MHKQAYITIVGASLATGYFAGWYISSVKEHGGKSSITPRYEVKATEPDGDDSESETPSEAGDGDLAQVKPSLEEEYKLVGFIHHSTLRPGWSRSKHLGIGPRCTKRSGNVHWQNRCAVSVYVRKWTNRVLMVGYVQMLVGDKVRGSSAAITLTTVWTCRHATLACYRTLSASNPKVRLELVLPSTR
jgi:hypothetical protein